MTEQPPAEQMDLEVACQLLETNEHLRRFLSRFLFSDCGVHNSTFALDPISSAYNQGQRDAGLLLIRELEKRTPLLPATMYLEFLNVPSD